MPMCNYYHLLKYFFLLCWAFLMLGCQSKQDNVPAMQRIETNISSGAELKLSDYFKDFQMIKLPTDSLIGEIERIKYENNRIYISDGQSLFTFSETGGLISYFRKRGEGPEEYSRIEDFMVNDKNIIVLDRGRQKLITYDHAGNHISTYALGHYAQAISPIVNNTCFLYNGFDPNYKLYRVRNGVEDSTYLTVDKQLADYLFIFAHHNFYQYQNAIYFFQPMNDTVFQSIDGNGMVPSFYVDFKGRNIPASIFREKYNNIKEFIDEVNKRSYAYGIYSFVINDRLVMFGSFYDGEKKLTLFDRKKGISNTFATIKDDIYFKGLTLPVSQFIYHANPDNLVIVPIEAFSAIEWRERFFPSEPFKKMVSTTKEEDNPLLLLFRFK